MPGRFRGITADTVILDELDDYPDVGEGDVISLAARASTNSPWKLMIVGSTPTAKSTSQIARAMESVDLILDWNIPCPECGEHQAPKWSDIVFDAEGEDVERAASAKMACRACGVLWTHDRLQGGRFQAADDVVAEGSLSDGKPWPPRVGLRINALSSPFTTWSDLVLDWLAAQGDILKLQVFTNHVLGEVWVDEDIIVRQGIVAAREDDRRGISRRRPYPRSPGSTCRTDGFPFWWSASDSARKRWLRGPRRPSPAT